MLNQPVVLSVHGLRKDIRRKAIIKGVSFEVRAGEVFGFLGPNGAGKTTTIRMLVHLIRPTEGTITICGESLHKNPEKALQHVGCIVENPELYSYLTGWENLEHFARMLPRVGVDRIREVIAIVGMEKRIHDKVKTYSLGMRQRLGIAQALLGNPRLLILDEPTNGLDPQGIKEMREFIRKLAAGGLSVFVSSHLLSEIELMCDRVAIISHGEIISVGQVDELLSKAETRVLWHVTAAPSAIQLLSPYMEPHEEQAAYGKLRALSHSGAEDDHTAVGSRTKLHHDRMEISVLMPSEHVPIQNRKLLEAGIDVYSVTIKHPTLEELFLALTEGEVIG